MQVHILSFEGPDGYARAGGISSRITGLSEALAHAGFATHLWFVGDPERPGHETQGNLHLHRWCQWISKHHPHGVYDGEHTKCADYAKSLPPFLLREVLGPALARGERAIVLAEEWHTAAAVQHLHGLLQHKQLRQQVAMLWNANNTFGFQGIDWEGLKAAASITTVSRYMRQLMRSFGVEACVIPNGLAPDSFVPPDDDAVAEMRHRLGNRVVLAKVARFDPDKQWLLAIDTLGELKRQGARAVLLARGGLEAHGAEVMARASAWGLRVSDRKANGIGVRGTLEALNDCGDADVVNLRSHLDPDSRRMVLRGVDAVLANSSHEPFGLVGLETMAAGGIACTGCSGEDYAIAGRNAMVLQTADPREFTAFLGQLKQNPEAEKSMRRAGQITAHEYAWPSVLETSLLPRLQILGPTEV